MLDFDGEASSNEQIAPGIRQATAITDKPSPHRLKASSVRSFALLGMTERELEPDEIDQKLAPEIDHAPPGIFNIACRRLCKNAFVNVVGDLVPEILFHFCLNLLFIEGVDFSGINSVPAEKFAVTLIKLPERSIRPLSIYAEQRSEFQPIGQRIIPCRPNVAVFGARRNA